MSLSAISSSTLSSYVASRILVVPGTEVTDEQLKLCAVLFTENYGVWGQHAPAPLKAGTRVRMTPAKLRQMLLSKPEDSALVMSFAQDRLVGHAFVSKWRHSTDVVVWVTQLVVDAKYRRRYIATFQLQALKYHPWFHEVTMVGVASSHPAACHAVCKLSHITPSNLDLYFIARNAPAVISSTHVEYLKSAPLRGSLFQDDVTDGSISSIDTAFFVDHTEPNRILAQYVADNKWALGELVEGHEFLVLVPVAGTQ